MPVKLTSEASADDLQERALLAKRQRINRRVRHAHLCNRVLVGARSAPYTQLYLRAPKKKPQTACAIWGFV